MSKKNAAVTEPEIEEVDFTKAELEAGVYPATITKAVKHIGKSGNECIKFTFCVDDESEKGSTMTMFLVKKNADGSPVRKSRWTQLGKALGLQAEDLTQLWKENFGGVDKEGTYHYFDRMALRVVIKVSPDPLTGYPVGDIAGMLPMEEKAGK